MNKLVIEQPRNFTETMHFVCKCIENAGEEGRIALAECGCAEIVNSALPDLTDEQAQGYLMGIDVAMRTISGTPFSVLFHRQLHQLIHVQHHLVSRLSDKPQPDEFPVEL